MNIWSKNKYIDILINGLLFLMATNFMRYGHILIPIVCLILFVDNGFKLKVNDIRIFLILIVFGIVFFVFSDKENLFCFMGLIVPMAYYIGSNVYEPGKNKIKYIIYLLALGMATHIILNFGYDLAVRGIACFSRNSHLDFWYKDEFPTTQTAVNYVFMIGIIYYLLVYENNRKALYVMISTFCIIMIYAIALGRRTPFGLIFSNIVFSIILDRFYIKNNNKRSMVAFFSFLMFIIIFVVLLMGYYFNLFGLKEFVSNLSIVKKISRFGLYMGRFEILIDTLKLAPEHLFGGREISTILDIEPHDLWMDTFNYAGIFALIPLVVYSVHFFRTIWKVVSNTHLSKKYRLLLFGVFFCILTQFILEPVMTGSSIFFLCSVIVFTIVENLI